MDWTALGTLIGVAAVVIGGALETYRRLRKRGPKSDPKGGADAKTKAPDPAELMREVRKLIGTIENDPGCRATPVICEQRFDRLEVFARDQAIATEAQRRDGRKLHAGLRKLNEMQDFILEHLTNGGPSTRQRPEPLSETLDDESTGRYFFDGEGGVKKG